MWDLSGLDMVSSLVLAAAGWSYEVAAPPDCVPVAEVLGSVDVAQVRAEPRKPW